MRNSIACFAPAISFLASSRSTWSMVGVNHRRVRVLPMSMLRPLLFSSLSSAGEASPDSLQQVPLIPVLPGQPEIVDQHRIVGLGAKPGLGPVLAAGPDPARPLAVEDDEEFVMPQRAGRDHAVVKVDAFLLQGFARALVLILPFFLTLPLASTICARLPIFASASSSCGIVQFVQRGIDLALLCCRLVEDFEQALAQRPGEIIRGRDRRASR